MSATLTSRRVGKVLILDVVGRITLFGGGAESLRDTIRDCAAKGEKDIILNLAGTSWVDSCGIGELVSGFTRLNNQGAQLKLLAIAKRVKDLLQITKLYTVFEIFDDETKAVNSFY